MYHIVDWSKYLWERMSLLLFVSGRHELLYQNPKSSKAFLVQGPSHTGQETSRQPPVARENLLSTAGCKWMLEVAEINW